jgi:hypothetical protein
MKRILQLSITLAAALAASATAWAQTTTSTSSSAGVLSTAAGTTSATGVKKKPTSATADMINEAIQRSEARAAKELQTGVPQRWGSEEPFAYNPTVKRFDKSMQ